MAAFRPPLTAGEIRHIPGELQDFHENYAAPPRPSGGEREGKEDNVRTNILLFNLKFAFIQ